MEHVSQRSVVSPHFPRPSRNVGFLAVQILSWLLYRPAVWKQFLATIDPELPPDVTFADLKRRHWHTSQMRHVLYCCVLIVLAIGIISGIAFSVSGFNGDMFSAGVFGGIVLASSMILLLGIEHSIAVGFMVSSFVPLLYAGAYIAAPGLGYPTEHVVRTAIAYGLIFGLAGGLIATVSVNTQSIHPTYRASVQVNLLRRLSTTVFGIIVAAALLFTLYSVMDYIESRMFGSPFPGGHQRMGSMWLTVVLGGIIVILLLIVVGRKQTLRIVLSSAIAFGLAILSNVLGYIFNWPLYTTTNITFCITISLLVGPPFVLLERLASTWIGATTTAIGLGAGWIVWMTTANEASLIPALPLGMLMVVIGLGLVWGATYILYIPLCMWNYLVLRYDERRNHSQRSLLAWHAAFWQDSVVLQFPGLVEHLLLAAERNPQEGWLALAQLRSSRQHWAVIEAEMELDFRRLEQCHSIEQLRCVGQTITALQTHRPEGAYLRTFADISHEVDKSLRQGTNLNIRLQLKIVEKRLIDFQMESAGRNDMLTKRTCDLAGHWRVLIARTIDHYAVEFEHQQQVPNPYKPGSPFAPFVGREAIANRLALVMLDPEQPPVLLYGQRRMGKTSLLVNLGAFLPRTIVPLFVDGEGGIASASSYGSLLYGVAKSMIKSAKDSRDLVLPGILREALERDPFAIFDDWLDAVEAAMDTQGYETALLALDELEEIDRVLNKGRFDEDDILGMFRHLIQHRPRFRVLLAGSHTLQEFARWASYLINMQVVQVGYLDVNAAKQLIEFPMEPFSLHYEPVALQRVLDLTRCHPCMIQLLCYEIVLLKNQHPIEQRLSVTVADVEAAIEPAVQTGTQSFSGIYSEVDRAGRILLRTMAMMGEGVCIERRMLRDSFGDDLDVALTLPLRRQIIEQNGDGYRFQVELIRRWIAQAQE